MINFGIIASISWHSQRWKGFPHESDYSNSKFRHVQEGGGLHESINFANIKPEPGGWHIGYTPAFQGHLPDVNNSKDVNAIFFVSRDYREERRKLVGLYLFPEIGRFERTPSCPLSKNYDWGNMRVKRENMFLLHEYLPIDEGLAWEYEMLDNGKGLAQQGFNYLSAKNVLNIITYITKHNKGLIPDEKIEKLKSSILTTL